MWQPHARKTATEYAISRAARIYSVAVPALTATFILDAAGCCFNPGLYNESWGYVPEGRLLQFACGLFFVHRLWYFDITQGSNLPYWSLGYEVWYYVIFGLAIFSRGPQRIALVGAAYAIAGPAILSMFPLWLLGAACWTVSKRPPPKPELGAICAFLGSVGWISYEIWAQRHGRLIGIGSTWTARPEIAQDYLVATCFALQLFGISQTAPWLESICLRLKSPASWLAGATFSLYLFHLPVAQFIAAAMPFSVNSIAGRLSVVGGTLIIVFVLAEFTERRKKVWRNLFRYITHLATGRLTVARAP